MNDQAYEELTDIVTEIGKQEPDVVTEGFMDRMAARTAGVVGGVKQLGHNIANVATGTGNKNVINAGGDEKYTTLIRRCMAGIKYDTDEFSNFLKQYGNKVPQDVLENSQTIFNQVQNFYNAVRKSVSAPSIPNAQIKPKTESAVVYTRHNEFSVYADTILENIRDGITDNLESKLPTLSNGYEIHSIGNFAYIRKIGQVVALIGVRGETNRDKIEQFTKKLQDRINDFSTFSGLIDENSIKIAFRSRGQTLADGTTQKFVWRSGTSDVCIDINDPTTGKPRFILVYTNNGNRTLLSGANTKQQLIESARGAIRNQLDLYYTLLDDIRV